MTNAIQPEILDLRHFAASALRPLLEQESRLWADRIRWDYRNSIELLLGYFDQRSLPGYVALTQGKVTGYVFCVYEGSKAIVGGAFASPARSARWFAGQPFDRASLRRQQHRKCRGPRERAGSCRLHP